MVVPTQYMDALGVVTKSLAHLAAKKREAEDEFYMIDFDKLGECPCTGEAARASEREAGLMDGLARGHWAGTHGAGPSQSTCPSRPPSSAASWSS